MILASELMLEMSNNSHIAYKLNKNQGWRNPCCTLPCARRFRTREVLMGFVKQVNLYF